LGVLAELARVSDRTTLEHAVRAATPKAFLDLNLDALAAGYRLAAQGAATTTAAG
jgi:2-oxoglutarate ferredoxin oxidoreductase subunit gamma